MPSRFGNHKTAYNMFRRYSLNGVWNKIHGFLVSWKAEMSVSMLDASFAGAHRTSASLAVGVGSERAIGKSKGGWTTKIQTYADAMGRPVAFHLTGGNVSDYVGYEMLPDMADGRVEHLIGDRGYDSNKIRSGLEERGIQPCIPGRPTERRKSNTTRNCTRRGTGSKTPLPRSRTGDTSQCATTDARKSFSE